MNGQRVPVSTMCLRTIGASIFPNRIKREALMVGDSNKFKRFSTHDTPIAFQLPDWNRWLPELHPYDAFGKPQAEATDNFKRYKSTRQSLEGKTPAQIRDWFNDAFAAKAEPTWPLRKATLPSPASSVRIFLVKFSTQGGLPKTTTTAHSRLKL